MGVESIVFDRVILNLILIYVDEVVEFVRRENVDFVVGFGGGSVIDSVKVIVMIVKSGGKYWDYVLVVGGGKKLSGVLLIVVIFIIYGIGIEVDFYVVIINFEMKEK